VSSAIKEDLASCSTTTAQKVAMRILCLGNDLLGDDSLGSVMAEHIRQFAPPEVEVVSTFETGFHLLDYVLNTKRLVVIDTVRTGTAPTGTIYVFRDDDLKALPGGSPHYVGLYEVLALSRRLGLPVAEEVAILAVEAADCSTLGGEMHPAVRAAIPVLIRIVRDSVAGTAGKSAAKAMAMAV
jgi:hydrogenase maturation protease